MSIDILNALAETDLSSVNTSFPLLKPGMYLFNIVECKLEDNKAGTGKNLKIKLVSTEELPATSDGQEIMVKAGYPLFHVISLTPTDKYDPLPNCARFREAAMGTKAGAFMPLEQYINQNIMAKVIHDGTPDSQYGVQARVKDWVKKS